MASYNALESSSPYPSADPYYSSTTGLGNPSRSAKKPLSKWIKFGLPVAVLVIAGAVVGGVVGSRHKNNSSTSSGSSGGGPAASSAVSAKNAAGIFPTATDPEYMVPIYPSTTNDAAFSVPTVASSDSSLEWPADPSSFPNPSPTNLRSDRPRLIAAKYKWDALPSRIAAEPYLRQWNATIFANASNYYSQPPVPYVLDGGSGILDVARAIKMRVKGLSYVARMTNDTKWVDRVWAELQNAAGNGTTSFGNDTDRWNPAHFLDTAELSAAFGIAYDWLYNFWTADQKAMIRSTLNKYGLAPGVSALQGDANGWWSKDTKGNWNCVCNAGLTMGALAIYGDDTTGNAQTVLAATIANANQNCVWTVTPDGTNNETDNYWYFATTAHAEMTSSLIAAAGSDLGLLTTNPDFNLTGLFHMYVFGQTSLFSYGDHGPNKYSTTANAMFLYATAYNLPLYALYQRDRLDAPEPNSIFWYDPATAGAWWNQLPLDRAFPAMPGHQWVSCRGSWTDEKAMWFAMKGGTLQGHLTHGDLDNGDFVIDALGQRWAGDNGNGNYLSAGYFAAEAQNSSRWLYYQKRTEGQNTILVNQQNQLVTAQPKMTFSSSGTVQGSSTVFDVPSDSTAFVVFDLTSSNADVTSWLRGMRFLNKRRQVLLQDDINTTDPSQWRMHTNATITVGADGTSATLTQDGQTLIMTILNAPSGAKFTTGSAVRLTGDPALPTGQPDEPTTGVTVMMIDLAAGQSSLQVLFSPQWPGLSQGDYVTPKSVALTQWSLTSHN